jgi:hypothetical protein
LGAHREQIVQMMANELNQQTPEAEPEKEASDERQANAAVVLLTFGEAEHVWPLFRFNKDPQRRTFLIHRLAPFGLDPRILIERLEVEADDSAKRALILSLGEYGPQALPDHLRAPLVAKLLNWYENDRDPGIHGAIDWLLRHGKEGPQERKLDWGQESALEQLAKQQKERALQRKPVPPTHCFDAAREGKNSWYLNKQGGARHGLQLVPPGLALAGGNPFTLLTQVPKGARDGASQEAHPAGRRSPARRRRRRHKPDRQALRPRRTGLGDQTDRDRGFVRRHPRVAQREDAGRRAGAAGSGPSPRPHGVSQLSGVSAAAGLLRHQ